MDQAYKRALKKIEEAYKTGATKLDLSSNQLSSLPAEIGKLQKLTTLDLSYNHLSSLPPEIGKLQKLTKLYLLSTQLSILPPEIGKLQKLTELYLDNNHLSSLPPEIGKLQKLTKLYLSENQLSSFPSEIEKLQNLTVLGLRSNHLSILPPEIGKLQKLAMLSLSSNQLSILSLEIGKLQKLTWLSLGYNQLRILPPEIGKLQKLAMLDLIENQLRILPPEIGTLQNLRELDLRANQLRTLPPEIGKLQNLTSLSLGGSRLGILPPEIFNLQNLTSLYLGGSQVHILPPEIGKLENLTKLYLSYNQLCILPSEIGKLKNLALLDLRSNQLSSLPPEVGKLQNLTELNLGFNQLSSLPREIKHLQNLASNQQKYNWNKGLLLQGNKFDFPEEVYQKEPQELIEYILNWQEEKNKKPIHEAKVILLGHGEMGKTSLVNRIIEDRFNPHEEQTKGIEVRDWAIKRGSDKINLHIWDFGGQELMHATHKFFMTKRSLYLLVTNPRQNDKYGESDIDYWMRLIQSYAGKEVPVIVVINKCDIHQVSMRKRGILDEYPQIIDIVETSCKTRRGIDELIARIQKVIQEDKLPHIDDRITEAEYHIKEALEAEKQKGTSYLSYFEYNRICWKVDEDIKESLTENLLGLLHDLGVMLNFCHGYQTRAETQVLNPAWVTEGVYAIVNAQHLMDTGGKLCMSMMGELLNVERYPSKKEHQLIMGVMKEFELAYQIGGSTEYLVPGSLPEDIPKRLAWEPDGGAQLRFRYTYEILPKSIMSRFIVKMHQAQKEGEGTLWRSGIVLEEGGCEALIQANAHQECIDITLQGKGNRVRLLAKIQAHFEEIHRSFEAIGCKGHVFVSMRIGRKLKEAWVPYEALLKAERKGKTHIYWYELDEDIPIQEVLRGYRWKQGVLDGVATAKEVRVLMFAASPTDEEKLQVEKEELQIRRGLTKARYGAKFRIEAIPHAQKADLTRVLKEMPHVVHFAGHGGQGPRSLGGGLSVVQRFGLVFENARGGSEYLWEEESERLFEPFREQIECVFLNACHSDGVLQSLKDKVRYLVGVMNTVKDDKAVLFAPAFYEALAQGLGVEGAFKAARNRLELLGRGTTVFRLYVEGRLVK